MVEKYRGEGGDGSSRLLGGQGRSGKSRGVRYEQARVNLLQKWKIPAERRFGEAKRRCGEVSWN